MSDKILTADELPGFEPTTAAPKPRRKPRTKPAPKPVPPVAREADVTHWATFGVAFTLVLSAGLNGYANAQHAPVAWAGWLMGLSVPVIVLTLSKVAGSKHRGGNRPAALLAGGSGAGLLFLSVWHCAESIALLTGSGLVLAVPMAVAIDCGLVACEYALVTEPRA
jgi:hypothetical protein